MVESSHRQRVLPVIVTSYYVLADARRTLEMNAEELSVQLSAKNRETAQLQVRSPSNKSSVQWESAQEFIQLSLASCQADLEGERKTAKHFENLASNLQAQFEVMVERYHALHSEMSTRVLNLQADKNRRTFQNIRHQLAEPNSRDILLENRGNEFYLLLYAGFDSVIQSLWVWKESVLGIDQDSLVSDFLGSLFFIANPINWSGLCSLLAQFFFSLNAAEILWVCYISDTDVVVASTEKPCAKEHDTQITRLSAQCYQLELEKEDLSNQIEELTQTLQSLASG